MPESCSGKHRRQRPGKAFSAGDPFAGLDTLAKREKGYVAGKSGSESEILDVARRIGCAERSGGGFSPIEAIDEPDAACVATVDGLGIRILRQICHNL